MLPRDEDIETNDKFTELDETSGQFVSGNN